MLKHLRGKHDQRVHGRGGSARQARQQAIAGGATPQEARLAGRTAQERRNRQADAGAAAAGASVGVKPRQAAGGQIEGLQQQVRQLKEARNQNPTPETEQAYRNAVDRLGAARSELYAKPVTTLDVLAPISGGSDKQRTWAETIRSDTQKQIQKSTETRHAYRQAVAQQLFGNRSDATIDMNLSAIDAGINRLFQSQDAQWWIDTRTKSPQDAVATASTKSQTEQEPPMDLKMSRRHSAADESYLKMCRRHIRQAMKALDAAGAPMDDDEGDEMKALDLHDRLTLIQDAVLNALEAAGAMPEMEDDDEDPEVYVYDDHAVVEDIGGNNVKVPYTLNDDETVTVAPPAEWMRVTWEPVDLGAWTPPVVEPPDDSTLVEGQTPAFELVTLTTPAGSVKALSDDRLSVRGVVYGGRDLVGDTFTSETDLGFGRSPVGMPVYYDHAQRGIKSQIGHVTAWQADDDGVTFEVELDRHHKYKEMVLGLARKQAMGSSSGAASHLVIRQSGILKRWIIAELSLTPTPMEPRTLPPVKTVSEALGERAVSDMTEAEIAALVPYLFHAYSARWGNGESR